MLRRLLAWLTDDPDREGDLWDLVPDWQYGHGGRLHGGGIARDEQESAVEDVAERGEELAEARER
jgi:hypothetical protein